MHALAYICFSKPIPLETEMICFWVRTMTIPANANRSVGNGLYMFTSKKVLNIEFSRRSSCYLLKSSFSIARPISEASTCESLISLRLARPLTFS